MQFAVHKLLTSVTYAKTIRANEKRMFVPLSDAAVCFSSALVSSSAAASIFSMTPSMSILAVSMASSLSFGSSAFSAAASCSFGLNRLLPKFGKTKLVFVFFCAWLFFGDGASFSGFDGLRKENAALIGEAAALRLLAGEICWVSEFPWACCSSEASFSVLLGGDFAFLVSTVEGFEALIAFVGTA